MKLPHPGVVLNNGIIGSDQEKPDICGFFCPLAIKLKMEWRKDWDRKTRTFLCDIPFGT
jgi:hypothetical protein